MISECLLDAIYAVVTSEDALAGLLAVLAREFDCISAALVYVDPVRPAADVVLGHGVFSGDAQRRYELEYAAIDPAPAKIASLPLGTAGATDRLFSAEQRASLRFVTEFYHPLGLHEALGAPIARSDGKFGILAIHRGNNRPSFTDDEIALFGALSGHVARAIALRSRFFCVLRSAETRRDMLDNVAVGIMAVDAHGRLIEANSAARAILAREDGLSLARSGRIRASSRLADAALKEAFAKTSASIIPIPRTYDDHAYILKVRPGRTEFSHVKADCLVQIADNRPTSDAVDKVLVRALHLSGPSARLVAALLRGEDIRSYAEQAGISVNTAKFHLKAAFRVTNTHRQVELVRMAASILRDLSV